MFYPGSALEQHGLNNLTIVKVKIIDLNFNSYVLTLMFYNSTALYF